MIDPRELRIGNYFQWSPFASMGKGIDRITHGQQIMDYAELKEPIELTPEWLERASYKQFPENIKFVHEAQNWYYWNFNKTELRFT